MIVRFSQVLGEAISTIKKVLKGGRESYWGDCSDSAPPDLQREEMARDQGMQELEDNEHSAVSFWRLPES